MRKLLAALKLKLVLLNQVWMGRLLQKMLGPHVTALVVKTENGQFAIAPDDYEIGKALRKKGRYGQTEVETLKPYLMPQSRVLIVGAHIGTLVIPIAHQVAEVVAVEANPATYGLLTMNLALNHITNCQAINIAASNQTETLEFLINRANSGGTKRVPQLKKFIYYYDQPEIQRIPAVSLDEYLADQAFDVILMDIEGSEYFALLGMQRLLSHAQALMVEFLPHHLTNVSGVTVAEFVGAIAPHFSHLTIPSQGIVLEQRDFIPHLEAMVIAQQGDDGILFRKD
ncbi:FkbM family methyltransferase [Spirulina sp. CCNP1310]|uniref:FkbM family methyltransferase n=1 Tax=Spirulina sp. CCNP1310 TaxID=3110249 RepID=UPI002B2047C5|nr:FkbM family methyltransferase [Spirulina sp. CCNP1310]MEA5421134.1 FkbM family methyltransferase [Spirulina sp. CCNP1310]